MDFTFDLSQTPVIGRKYLPKAGSQPATGPSSLSNASTATPDKGKLVVGRAKFAHYFLKPIETRLME